jgi:hypothetical protein
VTPVLSQNVTFIEGITQSSAIPARMELFDARLVITTINDETGDPIETVLDAALTDIKVSGNAAILVFKVGELKRRVDFSFAARAVMAAPGGVFAAASLIKESGIYTWLDEFRSRNVSVKYFSMANTWAVALAAVAIIVMVIAVIGVNRMGS